MNAEDIVRTGRDIKDGDIQAADTSFGSRKHRHRCGCRGEFMTDQDFLRACQKWQQTRKRESKAAMKAQKAKTREQAPAKALANFQRERLRQDELDDRQAAVDEEAAEEEERRRRRRRRRAKEKKRQQALDQKTVELERAREREAREREEARQARAREARSHLDLPPGWTTHWDEGAGKRFFHNAELGISQWEPPPQEPPTQGSHRGGKGKGSRWGGYLSKQKRRKRKPSRRKPSKKKPSRKKLSRKKISKKTSKKKNFLRKIKSIRKKFI